MNGLIWSHPARRDLFAIAAYYATIDPALPETLLDRIEQTPLILLDFPGLGAPTLHPGIRKWLVPGTPFLLLYAARPGSVQIRRVLHDRSEWEKSR